ncbi:hypothetical protein G4B88_015196 [Cannabis sativa]|uniref:Uncharacterized protein n=1 Tax=Cannabis sativa TaxID=3483 RepID=A0A7J6DYB5_CANSA|nr:hypothetical protein G4B88_015196 [Cannabis sativa]
MLLLSFQRFKRLHAQKVMK